MWVGGASSCVRSFVTCRMPRVLHAPSSLQSVAKSKKASPATSPQATMSIINCQYTSRHEQPLSDASVGLACAEWKAIGGNGRGDPFADWRNRHG